MYFYIIHHVIHSVYYYIIIPEADQIRHADGPGSECMYVCMYVCMSVWAEADQIRHADDPGSEALRAGAATRWRAWWLGLLLSLSLLLSPLLLLSLLLSLLLLLLLLLLWNPREPPERAKQATKSKGSGTQAWRYSLSALEEVYRFVRILRGL